MLFLSVWVAKHGIRQYFNHFFSIVGYLTYFFVHLVIANFNWVLNFFCRA